MSYYIASFFFFRFFDIFLREFSCMIIQVKEEHLARHRRQMDMNMCIINRFEVLFIN